MLESNSGVFSFKLVNVADSLISGTCEATSESAQLEGCAWGPSDDMKYRYLCEIGGSFNYGTETYQCTDANLPTRLFCPDLVAAAENLMP